MKILLAMILMLGVSLPALAAEKKIICHVQNQGSAGSNNYTIIYIVDSVKNTIKMNNTKGEFSDLENGYVTDEAFGQRESSFTVNGEGSFTVNVDRSNGEYRETFLSTGEVIAVGTCAPFKQAF